MAPTKSKKSVAKKPVSKKPVARKAVSKTVAAKPGTKTAAKKPAAKKAAAKKPAGKAPAAKQPAKRSTAKVAVARLPAARKVPAKKPPLRPIPTEKPLAPVPPEQVRRDAAPRGTVERRSALEVIEGGQLDGVTTVPSAGAGLGALARGKYVYCVVRSARPLRFGKNGLGTESSEVTTVNYRDLAAVVSEVPMGVLDPTRENVLTHQQVTERVMRDFTVLPMSFGTVFKTDEDIVELLKSAYDAFGDVLSKMQDKFEFGLKVLWDRDRVIKELEAEDEDLRRLKSEIANQKGSTYFARMQYGRMVDGALQDRSERYVSEIFELLRDVSVASRSNKPIGDRMIMNAAFLVAREKEAAFDARVKAIGARFDSLTFKYTGPWPAYNFVNIRLKLERATP